MWCKIIKKPRSAEATNVPCAGNRLLRKIFARVKKGLHLELVGFSYLLAVLICALPFILLMLSTSASGEELQNQVQPYLSHQPVHPSDNLRNEWGIILTKGLYSGNIHSQIGSVEMFSKTEDSNENDMEMPSKTPNTIKIFMCGDVMTGRGIDQVLPNQCNPVLYEPYVKDARRYVELVEEVNGPIPQPVSFSYIWGDALEELKRRAPDLRIINLETSITASEDYWKGKGINYRMHPGNILCLTAAKIDVCSLANNHILDWGYSGLTETLATLRKGNIKYSGAGQNIKEAETPTISEIQSKGRVIVFSFGSFTSGIPFSWAATENRPGVNFLKDLSGKTVRNIKYKVEELKRKGDIVIASIHWGGNWGYEIPAEHIAFAHKLIDEAGVDIIHGHSQTKRVRRCRLRPRACAPIWLID
jgi:poly-gamma-glutamate capsule biosynthesis protein CapA/YwtB (metallophosphatase superfamily)